MIPVSAALSVPVVGVPRIRGDDPDKVVYMFATKLVFPAYAGMIPHGLKLPVDYECVPRIRGDDPLTPTSWRTSRTCSPHTRG